MSARREASDADERFVDFVLFGVCLDETDCALHVVDLSGKLFVAARPVIDAHHGKSCVQERFAEGEIGDCLHVVGKPCGAVDGDDCLVGCFAGLGQVDVETVRLQVVAGIIDILEIRLHGRLHIAKTSVKIRWLCNCANC